MFSNLKPFRQNNFSQAEQIFLQTLDDWPDQTEIYQQIFMFYATWSNTTDTPHSHLPAIERRTRDMFSRWIRKRRHDQSDLLPYPPDHSDSWNEIFGLMESLTQQYPHSRPLHIIYSELFAARGDLDLALKKWMQFHGILGRLLCLGQKFLFGQHRAFLFRSPVEMVAKNFSVRSLSLFFAVFV